MPAELTVVLGGNYYAVNSPWGRFPDGVNIDSISQVATDSDDRLYIFQRSDPPILILKKSGEFEGSWGEGLISDAHGIFITDDDRVFLVDRDGHQVIGARRNGEVHMALGTRREPKLNGVFNHPTDVAVSADGSIYVSDGYANAVVHCFDSGGGLRWTRGRPGRGPGEFFTPHGIWVDSDGRVLVADRENDRIQVLDADGNFIAEWTDLYHPMDICSDADGNIYVTEQVPRVSMFTAAGELMGRCRTGRIAHGIWVDSRGDIYLAQMPDLVVKLVRR